MKRLILALLFAASVARADYSKELFRADVAPRSEFTSSGFVEATFYPPHNEYPANFGLPFDQEITARYSVTADVTVTHTPSGVFGRLYLFMPLGASLPKTSYNYRADPILLEVQPSLGWSWTPHMDVRLTYDEAFNLGKFRSVHEVTPWLGLSMRYSTAKPVDLWKIAELSGYVEPFIFAPGLEYPATPGASPRGWPVKDFSRDQIVNARYALSFNMRLQPKIKYLDRLFVFFNPEVFFGDATLSDHDRWGGAPLTAYLEWGFGAQITRNLDLRFTHGEFENLGGAPAGLLTLKGDGVSLRYSW